MQRAAYHRARQGPHFQDLSEWPGTSLAVNVPAKPWRNCRSLMEGPFPASLQQLRKQRLPSSHGGTSRRIAWSILRFRSKCSKVVGARLRRLVGIIEELSFTTIRQRLIAVLVKLAQSEGKKTERGIEFQLPGTHQELANQLGTVRELISRNLMRLQAEGLLEVDARQIVVKDMKGLSVLLDDLVAL